MKLLALNIVQVLRDWRRHIWRMLFILFSLSLGLVCFCLSGSQFWYETHNDDFRPGYRDLYVLNERVEDPNFTMRAVKAGPVKYLRDRVPDIEEMALFSQFTGSIEPSIGGLGGYVSPVSSSFLSLVGAEMLCGDAEHALDQPTSIVLTDAAALELYGTVEALGQPVGVLMPGQDVPQTFFVSGVYRVPSDRAHTNVICTSYVRLDETTELVTADSPRAWQCAFRVYLRTKHYGRVCEQLDRYLQHIKQSGQPGYEDLKEFTCVPLRYSHLNSNGLNLLNDFFYPVLLMGLSLLMLFTVVFNYVVVMLSKCTARLRTYKLRISLGGGLADNYRLFYAEVGLMLTGVLLLSAVLLELSGHVIDNLIPMSYIYGYFGVAAGGFAVLMLLASAYPLWRVGRLYRSSLAGGKSFHIGAPMLVLQVGVGMLLLFLTVTSIRQLRMMMGSGVGFDYDNVLVVSVPHMEANKPEVRGLAARLRQGGDYCIVDAVGSSFELVDRRMWQELQLADFGVDDPDMAFRVVNAIDCSPRLLSFFGIEPLQGEGFTVPYDGKRQMMFSPAMARLMPPGQTEYDCRYRAYCDKEHMQLKGILHIRSRKFTLPDEECVFFCVPEEQQERCLVLYVKYRSGKRKEAERIVRSYLEDMSVDVSAFEIATFAEQIENIYRLELDYLKGVFVILALSLFVMLFGTMVVVDHELERRRRDMAIRRVYGATFRDLVRRYLYEYMWLCAAAFVLSMPVGYYMINWWLEQYASHVSAGVWPALAVGGGVSALILWLVTYRIRSAMRTDAVEVIKEE